MKKTRTHATQIHEQKLMNVADEKIQTQVSPKHNGATNVAVEQIWNRFSAQLGQFIRARVAHPATAEDILHDVFLRFQSRLDEFRNPAKIRGWLFLVARNAIIDHWLARVITLGGELKFRQRTLDLAKLQSGDAVLDVGCGTGTLLIEAAKRIGPSGSTHGVDRSAQMLAHARRKAAAQGVTANFVEGSADRLAFPHASFDVVFCTLMLHHLPAPMQMATIAEMRRVLRPGGRIIIVDMQGSSKMSALFSPIGLVHLFRARATLPDWQKIEELLRQQGVHLASRSPIWGETACALVGRIALPPTVG